MTDCPQLNLVVPLSWLTLWETGNVSKFQQSDGSKSKSSTHDVVMNSYHITLELQSTLLIFQQHCWQKYMPKLTSCNCLLVWNSPMHFQPFWLSRQFHLDTEYSKLAGSIFCPLTQACRVQKTAYQWLCVPYKWPGFIFCWSFVKEGFNSNDGLSSLTGKD